AFNSTAGATWSVNGIQGGNSTVGTIDSTGLYKAPANEPNPHTVTVTASSGGQSAKSTGTIVYPNNNPQAQSLPVKVGTTWRRRHRHQRHSLLLRHVGRTGHARRAVLHP